MRLKILGIGSPFGADRIGWEVADALAERHPGGSYARGELRIASCDRPGVGLLEQLRDCDEAWIVDGLLGGSAGGLRWLAPTDLGLSPENFSTHGAGVAEALALGAALNEPLPKVSLLGVELGSDPAQAVPDAGLRAAAGEISQKLRELLGDPL